MYSTEEASGRSRRIMSKHVPYITYHIISYVRSNHIIYHIPYIRYHIVCYASAYTIYRRS